MPASRPRPWVGGQAQAVAAARHQRDPPPYSWAGPLPASGSAVAVARHRPSCAGGTTDRDRPLVLLGAADLPAGSRPDRHGPIAGGGAALSHGFEPTEPERSRSRHSIQRPPRGAASGVAELLTRPTDRLRARAVVRVAALTRTTAAGPLEDLVPLRTIRPASEIHAERGVPWRARWLLHPHHGCRTARQPGPAPRPSLRSAELVLELGQARPLALDDGRGRPERNASLPEPPPTRSMLASSLARCSSRRSSPPSPAALSTRARRARSGCGDNRSVVGRRCRPRWAGRWARSRRRPCAASSAAADAGSVGAHDERDPCPRWVRGAAAGCGPRARGLRELVEDALGRSGIPCRARCS